MLKTEQLKRIFRRIINIKSDIAEKSSDTEESDTTTIKKPLPRKEKKRLKIEQWKSKPLAQRIAIRSLKIIFIKLPLTLIVIIAATLFFIKIYFTAPTVEQLAVKTFTKLSYGNLKLKVESFNPYTGFVIRDIEIRSGDNFGKMKVFELERIVFSYDFFKIFTGSIRFPEIGIYNPRLYMLQKNGIWNVTALMKPSETKPEKEKDKEKEKKSEESSDEIKLPIAVDFFFNFILQDLRIYINGPDFNTELTGLTLTTKIDIPPFKKIPKSIDALKIIKTFRIELNPGNSMNLNFYSKEVSAKPELILNWKLDFINSSTRSFNSTMNIGARRMPLRLKNKFFSPFNFLISYDIFYNPVPDTLKIDNFTISFMNSNWLKLSGSVTSVMKNRNLNIKMNESRIPLRDIYPYYVLATGDRKTKFSGDISLYPLTVTGTAASPDIKGDINIKNLLFKNTGIETLLPFLDCSYSIRSTGKNMNIGAVLNMPHMTYRIEGSKSGDNGLKIKVYANAINNFHRIRINEISLDFYNPKNSSKVLSVNTTGEVSLAETTSGFININRFRINTVPLSDMLPGRFKKSISALPLKKPVDLKIGSNFSLASGRTNLSLNLSAAIPDYGLNDLLLKASVIQDTKEKRITLNHINLSSVKMNLYLNASGFVETKQAPLSDSGLNISLILDNPKLKSVFGPWLSSGSMKFTAGMKGDMKTGKAWGNLRFKDFNLQNNEQFLVLSDLNMNFPFEYRFKVSKQTGSSLSVTQKQVMDNDQFASKPNFTISSIRSKHPVRNIQFEYMKNFSTTMILDDKIFSITNLKASVMGGSVYARSILFNLADLNLNNMEFNLQMDVTNIDIGRLDDPDPKKSKKDAELSLSSNFSGRGLDIHRELTPSGYITIYKVGQEFANKLMKGLSEEKGKSKLGTTVQFVVDNTMLISGFDFRLDKGLMYTTVSLTRKALCNLIRVKNDRIQFDRIPIQEYLRKVAEAK